MTAPLTTLPMTRIATISDSPAKTVRNALVVLAFLPASSRIAR